MFRVNPPTTVDWYDVDFPEVLAVRQQVLPQRARAHGIGVDVTDAHWLDDVPASAGLTDRLHDIAPVHGPIHLPLVILC